MNVNKELLEAKIEESGLKKGYIIETMGLSRQGFSLKENNKVPFRLSEIFVICTLLNLSDEDKRKIFIPKVD